MLIGRERECSQLDELLDRGRLGRSGVLVLRGEPGIGKTALLEYAVSQAADMSIVRTLGVESEAELEYSALLDVCRPLLEHVEDLSEHQAQVLQGALGLGPTSSLDAFAVGAATLALVAAAADATPLLIVVDDAQWLDRPSRDALLFATRRLEADRAVVLFAARDDESEGFDAPGVQALLLEGLGPEAAVALVRRDTEAASEVAEQLYEATGGNPLALVELPSLLSIEQLEGRRSIEGPLPASSRVERAFARKAEGLPEPARIALLVAAATSTRGSAVVLAALAEFDVDTAALEMVEDAGLLTISDGTLEFRHPLVRSAVYQSASPSQRRAVHGALARVCAEAEPEEAAWHLASAAVGPDEEVASALAAAAVRARDRSAFLGASERFVRSARLTPDRDARLSRLTDAAEAAWIGGAVERTTALLAEAIPESRDTVLSPRLLRLQGRVELQAGTPDRARELFLESASLEADPSSPDALRTLGLAVFACHYLGEIASGVEIARRMRELATAGDGTTDLQADYVLGRSLLLAGATREGAPVLERVAEELTRADEVQRMSLTRAAAALAILERNRETSPLLERAVRLAREEGPMNLLHTLTLSSEVDVRQGRWDRALAAANEGLALARELDQPNIAAHFLLALAAVQAGRGEDEPCRTAADEALAILGRSGMRLTCEQVRCSLALLELGLDRVAEAVAILEPVSTAVVEMRVHDRDVLPDPDLIEALVRLDRRDEAAAALAAWVERGAETGTIAGPAFVARCRGLLVDDDFDALFVEAVAAHERIGDPFNEARTRLCFGEKLAARDPARRDELTPQELQIALQVAEGKTNKEVGAALFLSHKTIEFHLSRIYRKLDLNSRSELIRRFAVDAPDADPAPS